jgi:hypothetical protein
MHLPIEVIHLFFIKVYQILGELEIPVAAGQDTPEYILGIKGQLPVFVNIGKRKPSFSVPL